MAQAPTPSTTYLDTLASLMNGATETSLTHETIISGAEWRDFYQNHWPDAFYIDDIGVDFEDDRGNYILNDRARYPFELFGKAVWQGNDSLPFTRGLMIDVHLLYAAIMGTDLQRIVSFRVAPEHEAAVIEAARSAGATPI